MNPKPPLQRAIEKQVEQAPPEQRAKTSIQQALWPQFLTLGAAFDLPIDPTRWLWDRCLPAGGCSVLVAKPKIGKSTLAACLAIAVSRGMKFLGRDTQMGAVGYLSLDASMAEITETFRELGGQKSDPIFVHAGSAPADAVNWIMFRVKENDIKLVIIDTLQRLFRFQNVNDYSEVTNAMEPLMEQARQQNCHVMFTHHAKKDSLDDLDSAIGSTAIRGLAYTYIHMKRLPDSDRRIIRSDQRSGRPFSEYAIGFDKFGFLDLQGTREEAEIEEVEPKVIQWFADNPESTEKEMYGQYLGQPRITSRALRQLYKRGEIERIGKGKRGDPFRYSVARKLTSISSNKNNPVYSTLSLTKEVPIKEKLFSENSLDKSDTYSTLSEKIKENKVESRNDASIKEKLFTPTLADKLLAEIDKEKQR